MRRKIVIVDNLGGNEFLIINIINRNIIIITCGNNISEKSRTSSQDTTYSIFIITQLIGHNAIKLLNGGDDDSEVLWWRLSIFLRWWRWWWWCICTGRPLQCIDDPQIGDCAVHNIQKSKVHCSTITRIHWSAEIYNISITLQYVWQIHVW